MKNKKILFGVIGIAIILFIGIAISPTKEGPMSEAGDWQKEFEVTIENKPSYETEEIIPSASYKEVKPVTFKIKNETNRTQVVSLSAINVRPVNENEIPFDESLVNVLIEDNEGSVIFEGTLLELNSMRLGEMVTIKTNCKLINNEPDCTQLVKDITGLKENVDYIVIESYGFERFYQPGNTVPVKIKPNKSLTLKMYVWFSEDITEGDLVVGTYNPETGEKGTAKASLDFDLTIYQIDAELFKGVNKNSYTERWEELLKDKVVTFKEIPMETK